MIHIPNYVGYYPDPIAPFTFNPLPLPLHSPFSSAPAFEREIPEDWIDLFSSDLFNEGENKRKSAKENRLSRQEWLEAIPNALKILQQIASRQIDGKVFTFEKNQCRYTVKLTSMSVFKIFPWFHTTCRFRQTLKPEMHQGLTIERVLEAMNYFLKKSGSEYSEDEINFLRRYYEEMEIPVASQCLTTIVAVYNQFKKFQEGGELEGGLEVEDVEVENGEVEAEVEVNDKVQEKEQEGKLEIEIDTQVQNTNKEKYQEKVNEKHKYNNKNKNKNKDTKDIHSILPLPPSSSPSHLPLSSANLGLNNTILAHDKQLNSLHTRVKNLEDTIETTKTINTPETPESQRQLEFTSESVQQPREKKPRMGGDRACWFKIRDADYPSRHEWCVPGGVFGLHSDGVGPLLPTHIRLRRSVLVYSTSPDTIEDHPNPSHFDHYVRVVMVGEAPVNLRPDQYDKLRKGNCECDLYVTHLGDICVHFENDPPMKGVKFATTNWLNSCPQDEEGYPIFQGVRGVCAKIGGLSESAASSFKTENSLWKQTSRAIQTLILGELELPVRQVMTKRQEIFRSIAAIDREFDNRDLLAADIQRNSESIELRTCACQQLDRNEETQSTYELYQKMIEGLTKANADIQALQSELESQCSTKTLDLKKRELQRECARLTRQLERANPNSKI